jgi:hypothetical protein
MHTHAHTHARPHNNDITAARLQAFEEELQARSDVWEPLEEHVAAEVAEAVCQQPPASHPGRPSAINWGSRQAKQ